MTKRMTKADRCDRCGAEAFFLAMRGSAHLLFCNHHGRFHAPALIHQGWEILDESHRLTESERQSQPV